MGKRASYSPRSSLVRKTVSFNSVEILDDSMILATKKLDPKELDHEGEWVVIGETKTKTQKLEKAKPKSKKTSGASMANRRNGKNQQAQPAMAMTTRGNKSALVLPPSGRPYSTRGGAGNAAGRESTPPIVNHRRRTDYRKRI